MSETLSTMLRLGTVCPDFELTDVVSGKKVSPSIYKEANALLVMFICRHCPYVAHVAGELANIGKDYRNKSLGIIAISSNDAEAYPEDGPEGLREFAVDYGFNFPLLYDEMQDVAQAFTASCTPDFFLFDASRKLVYRGQLDDSRPGNGKPVTGKDLRQAIDAVLAGAVVSEDQKPSSGCNIKWKEGNEPEYFVG